MSKSKLGLLLALVIGLAAVSSATAIAGSAPAPYPVASDDNTKPMYTHVGGADPQATDQTIPHWFGTYVDGSNLQAYGYNMVGVDPASNGTSTVPVDIYPLNVVFQHDGGASMDGTNVVPQTIASPIFQSNNYSSTAKSTGGAGELSLNNNGQYEDAIMRSQFNKVGSNYHLLLGQPTVMPTITMVVPANQGQLAYSARGTLQGRVSVSWFSAQLNNLMNGLNLDPTRLPIFLTNNTMLFSGTDALAPGACCIIGYHGAAHATGHGTGKAHSNSGSTALQTFVYASYTTPGTFNQVGGFYIKDIHALSHEIAEWGDDPFVNNAVNPWLTPTAPQYGCTGVLETGDPVVGIGFEIGVNPYDTASTNQYADGTWHPEDEALLPWFARTSPNTTSQPVQGGTNGRYTFMGNLNPYPGFNAPATGC